MKKMRNFEKFQQKKKPTSQKEQKCGPKQNAQLML